MKGQHWNIGIFYRNQKKCNLSNEFLNSSFARK